MTDPKAIPTKRELMLRAFDILARAVRNGTGKLDLSAAMDWLNGYDKMARSIIDTRPQADGLRAAAELLAVGWEALPAEGRAEISAIAPVTAKRIDAIRAALSAPASLPTPASTEPTEAELDSLETAILAWRDSSAVSNREAARRLWPIVARQLSQRVPAATEPTRQESVSDFEARIQAAVNWLDDRLRHNAVYMTRATLTSMVRGVVQLSQRGRE